MQSIHLKIKEQKIAEEGIGQIAIHSGLIFFFTFILISPEQNRFILENSK